MTKRAARLTYILFVTFACVSVVRAQLRPGPVLNPNPGPGSGVLTPAFNRPVYMVTLGDSIMWGQGLPESNKFRNIVEQWIRSHYQGTRTVIQIPTHAHSGAKIVADMPEQAAMTGEIPRQWPSILVQVGLTVADLPRFGASPDQVDLVLVDGGANDVDFNHIVNPFEHAGNLHNLIEDACVGRMGALLLPAVRRAFPNAAIIVTGYFPDASSESDMTALLAFSTGVTTGAPMFAANNILSTSETLGAGVNAAIVGVGAGPALKDRMVELSNEWNDTAQAGLAGDIKQFIQNDPTHNVMSVQGFHGAPLTIPKVALAWPRFSKWNTYAAPQTFLWNMGQFAGDEARGVTGKHPEDQTTPKGVAYTRAQACVASGEATKGLCIDASMGHPNIAGAQAYADSIIDLLQGFPQWVGLGQLNVSASPATLKPNVLTNVTVQVTDFVTQKPVPNAVVHVGNQLVRSGQTFPYRISCVRPLSNPRATRSATSNPVIAEPADFPAPGFVVTAPGFVDSNVEFEVAGVKTGSQRCIGK